ncbi:MAG: hypothetical protein JO212_21140 [Acetobacteraceae bacterium]|nr:hypothetical protein [Acetobacteraceae bacterium]
MFRTQPMALLTGLGPGSSQTLAAITYEYGTSSPGKILLEYGVFGLIAYTALILANRRTQAQKVVLWPLLSILVLGGAYDHFAPVLFPVLLIGTVANLCSMETRVVAARSPGNNGAPATSYNRTVFRGS